MKKAFYLLLMVTATILTIANHDLQTQAATNIVENVARGPLTGPDGENLFSGGEHGITSPQKSKFYIHDAFTSWESSILDPVWSNATMSTGVLTISNNASVSTNPLTFEVGKTYRITLGSLTGGLEVHIYSYLNGWPLAPDLSLNSNGSSVSFLYTHRQISISTTPNHPAIINLTGVGSTTTINSITIEEI